MLERRTLGDVLWVGLESPTHDEVRSIAEELSIDALVAEELLLPTAKPRFELHPSFIFLILHFPALRHTHKTDEQEVDFIVGEKFIITTQYDTIDPMHKLSKVFEVQAMLDRDLSGQHAGYVLYFMLRKLYKSIEHEISCVHDALEDIESNIFKGREKEMVAALSFAGRDLLHMRQVIEPHRDLLKEMEMQAPRLFGDAFTSHLRHISNTYYRVHGHIMRHIETLHELRETNNSLVSTKQNEVMKVLTIMAFVTFPLSLIASIFGMNTQYLPIVGHKYDFLIVMGIMGFATFLMFVFFKRNHWL